MAVQSPQYRMTSLDDLMAVPVIRTQGAAVARQPGADAAGGAPAVVNHYNVQPVIDVYASTQDRDLGGVAAAHRPDHQGVRWPPAARHAHRASAAR